MSKTHLLALGAGVLAGWFLAPTLVGYQPFKAVGEKAASLAA